MPKLSLSGGSGQSISALMECPRKFKLNSEWEYVYKPIYFIEGSIFHDISEQIILGKMKVGIDKTCEDLRLTGIDWVYEAFETGKYYDEYKEDWLDFDPNELADKKNIGKTGKEYMTKGKQAIKRLPHQLLKVFMEKEAGTFDDVKETEYPLVLEELVNPETGKPSDTDKRLSDAGIVFAGRVDLLSDSIEDLKTSKQPNTVDAEEQMRIYAYLRTVDAGELVSRAVVHIFSKHTTKCEYLRKETELTLDDHIDAYRDLQFAGKQYIKSEKADFPKEGRVRCNCKDLYGQKCIYHKICFPHKYDDPKPDNLKRREQND